jgi:hypothetical protein
VSGGIIDHLLAVSENSFQGIKPKKSPFLDIDEKGLFSKASRSIFIPGGLIVLKSCMIASLSSSWNGSGTPGLRSRPSEPREVVLFEQVVDRPRVANHGSKTGINNIADAFES